jgi:hypothetical protein
MTNTGIVVRTWNDAPISRRDSDGYADATAMCQANGKLWGHYRETQRTSGYITALADATGLDPAQLIISTKGGPAHLQGTWIHPRLAVDLARWISPAFAVWMDGWFLDALNAPKPVTSRRSTPWASLSPISAEHLKSALPWCDPLTSAEILDWLDIPYTRGNQMALSTAMRSLGYGKRRVMIDGKQHWVYRKDHLARVTPQLNPGVHVIASNPRQANWLWKQAVEAEVSSALMRALAQENRQLVNPSHFQLHLLSA